MVQLLLLNNRGRGALAPRTPCNVIGAAISAASSLLGGLLSSSSNSSTNKTNLQIARETNEFNAKEAEKNRKWQEDYYNKFSSPSALAAQYRAAGLNAQLENVQPGSVASGSQAQAVGLPEQHPTDFSFVGNSGSTAVNSYFDNKVKDSVVNLNEAQKALKDAEEVNARQSTAESKARVDNMRQSLRLMQATFDDNVKSVYYDNLLKIWNRYDLEQEVRSKQYSYYNLLPEQVRNIQTQTLLWANNAIESLARGQLTLRDVEYYAKNFALRQTEAQASVINARASALNASTSAKLMSHNARYLDSMSQNNENQSMAFNIPLLHHGKLTKAGLALQYLNYNSAKSALINSIKQPEMMQAQKSLWQSMEYSNYGNTTNNVLNNVVDGIQSFTFNSSQETSTSKYNWRYDEKGNRFVTGGSETKTSGKHSTSGKTKRGKKFRKK